MLADMTAKSPAPQLLTAAAVSAAVSVVPALVGAWWLGLHKGPFIAAPWRWDPTLFNITPLMLPCWLLVGVSAGALAAVALRRTVPAMAATLATGVIVAIAADGLRLAPGALLAIGARAARQRVPMLTYCSSSGCAWPDPAGQPYRNGIVVNGWLTHGSHRLTASQAAKLAAQIPPKLMNASPGTLARWLSARHYTYWISFQPGSRYWLLQGVQAALLVALAVALAALAIWILRRRPV